MANEKQLKILKQGVESWNKWREENPRVEINLREAVIKESNLYKINLFSADLSDATFDKVNLYGANLVDTNFSGANLENSDFESAELWNTNFAGANLTGALFDEATINNVLLSKADFTKGIFGGTILVNIDLSTTIGLETIEHNSPSSVGIDTIQRSKGKIPIEFLRGCGLSDWEIESAKLYKPNMSSEEINMIQYRIHDLLANRPLQISPIFISYSHTDGTFVDCLEVKLIDQGVRFWRDIHDAKAGRLETQINKAIRYNPTVLLILSENSTKSDWVEHEVRLARKLEKDIDRDVLCPIALDDSWKTCKWPARIKEQIMEYNILDFSAWNQEAQFKKLFTKLIDGLDMFYKA